MKVTLYLTISVNGHIATADDKTPWTDIAWDTYLEAVKRFGNVIFGRRTYEFLKKNDDFKDFEKRPLVVAVTHSNESSNDQFKIVDSPVAALEAIKAAGFDNAMVGGGSDLATSFLAAGLVDEIELDIDPILIGKGINILKDVNLEQKLQFVSSKELSEGVLHLVYKVKKDSNG